jgi:hypothetical protein
MQEEKAHIRKELTGKLQKNNLFWSYHTPEGEIDSEELLIEKVLLYLDLEEIRKLFSIFPKEDVKRVWMEKMVPDSRYHSLNVLYAFLYFGINDPERYLEQMLYHHYKKLSEL